MMLFQIESPSLVGMVFLRDPRQARMWLVRATVGGLSEGQLCRLETAVAIELPKVARS